MGRTAIVMSGGGAKGAFELGAIDYLIKDKSIDPEVLVGVSTGTLNAVMLAQGKGREGLLEQLGRLKEIWFGIRENRDIYTTRFGGIFGLLFKADSLYSNRPLWRLIEKHVDPSKLKTSGRVLLIGVVELKSGEYFLVDGTQDSIREIVLASTAVPVAFNPVDIGTGRYVDGGVRDVTPLTAAITALEKLDGPPRDGDPDKIYVILASPLNPPKIGDKGKLDSGIDIGKRTLELIVNEIYRNDLLHASSINEALAIMSKHPEEIPPDSPFARYRYVDLAVIAPDRLYMDSLSFRPDEIQGAFNGGRLAAAKALAGIGRGPGINVDRRSLHRQESELK